MNHDVKPGAVFGIYKVIGRHGVERGRDRMPRWIVQCTVCKRVHVRQYTSLFSGGRGCQKCFGLSVSIAPRSRKCVECGKPFLITQHGCYKTNTCSPECRVSHRRDYLNRRAKTRIVAKSCAACETVFDGTKSGTIFCSAECGARRFKKVSKICDVCQSEFFGLADSTVAMCDSCYRRSRKQKWKTKKTIVEMGRIQAKVEGL